MAQRDADTFITNVERAFILKALRDNRRIDGRDPFSYRKLQLQFSLDDRTATVHMGTTRVMTTVTAELEQPHPGRPNEGSFKFNVEFSPMASPAFEPGKPGEDAIELARLIERSLRQSHAIDQEALCVLAGRKVWAVRVDTLVLDHGGNLVDAACLSALAALNAFRKPDVTVGGASGVEITIHPPEVKEPTPLSIHHLPVAVTFALFEEGDLIVVDPTLKEEAAQAGSLTLVLNPFREVCAVHKAHGIGLSPDQFLRCLRIASKKVEEIIEVLKQALEVHKVARVQARIRRHHAAGAGGVGALALGSSAVAEQQVKQIMQELDIQDDDAASEEESSSSEEEEELGAEGSMGQEAEEGPSNSRGADGEPRAAGASSRGGGADGRRRGGVAEMEVDGEAAAGGSGRELNGGVVVKAGLLVVQTGAGGATKRPGAKKAGAGGSKRPKQFDSLEAIAAAIAGADSPSGGEADLSAAVKRKGDKKKAKS